MFSCNGRRVSTLVVWLLLSLALSAHAHSGPLHPIKRATHPSTTGLEILPRLEESPRSRSLNKRATTLLHSDSFRLSLNAFGDVFHLHLSPNEHLVHPQAKIEIFRPGQSKPTIMPLHRENVLAYMGHVVSEQHTDERMRQDISRIAFPTTPDIGWARIMVHSQEDGRPPAYSGTFVANGVIHHIATKKNYLKTKLHNDAHPSSEVEDVDEDLVIWRESDVEVPQRKAGDKPMAHTCGLDSLSYNTDPGQNPFLAPQEPVVESSWMGSWSRGLGNSSLSRRQEGDLVGSNGAATNFQDSIGQTIGCPKDQRILFMGVAADCRYVQIYEGPEEATSQILNAWNGASALYKSTFNISLGITQLQIMDGTCGDGDAAFPWNVGCDSQVGLKERLSSFSEWRGSKQVDEVGLWHLMSGCPSPTGQEVGIAWLGTVCQSDAVGQGQDVVSGTGVSTAGRTEWQVIAHEIGHNFGAIHDCDEGCTSSEQCCPLNTSSCSADSAFVMSPVTKNEGTVAFSPCSIGNICRVMAGINSAQSDTSCLVDAATNTRQTISLRMCGNGILEPGEECDPGMGSNSPCCDAATCTFTSGSVCDPASGHTCCTQQCGFAGSGVVCRVSRDQTCDQQEMCPGNNGTCPEDRFTENGKSCGAGDLTCAAGACTSVSEQCRTLGGAMGLREACPRPAQDSCSVTCLDPKNSDRCVSLNQILVDGSPCGLGGTCFGGECKSAGALNTAIAWYKQNLAIAIPVSCITGIILLIILFFIGKSIGNCCRRRKDSNGLQRLHSN